MLRAFQDRLPHVTSVLKLTALVLYPPHKFVCTCVGGGGALKRVVERLKGECRMF
jgi:hypothetical protein